MKQAHYAISSLLIVGALVAACASSEETPADQAPTPDAAPSTSIKTDAGQVVETSTTKVCAPSCKTDNECQTTCDPKAGSLWCCDTGSGTCYPPSGSTCPVPDTDSGAPAY